MRAVPDALRLPLYLMVVRFVFSTLSLHLVSICVGDCYEVGPIMEDLTTLRIFTAVHPIVERPSHINF